jgi:hypothetical protein
VTPTPTAWEIESSDEAMVQVARASDSLEVTWICGDTFRFGREQLGEAIAHAEDLAPLDVWLRLHDLRGASFVVKVANGRLLAQTGAFGLAGGHVEWSELRELLAPPAPAAAATEGPWAEPTRWQRLRRRFGF